MLILASSESAPPSVTTRFFFLFLDVIKQTAIVHEGHYNVGGGSSIHAHANYTEHMRVLKIQHSYALFYHLHNPTMFKETCQSKVTV